MQDPRTTLFLGKHIEETQQEFLQRKTLEAFTDRWPDALSHMRRIHRLGSARKHGESGLLNPLASASRFEVGDKHLCHINPSRDSHDVRRAQKIVGSVVDKSLHDSCAVSAQDVRSVGYAQGLSENCRDRKPIGKSANRRGEECRLQKIPKESLSYHRQDSERADDTDGKRERSLVFFLQNHAIHPTLSAHRRRAPKRATASLRVPWRQPASA